MIEKLFDAEMKFVAIVWEHEPLTSRRLVELCEERLGWKKSTTYTVLRKLCDRGILKNEETIVTSIAKKADVQQYESRTVMERAFGDSLPEFIAAFMGGRQLSKTDADELKRLIDLYTEKSDGKGGDD